MGRCRAGRTRVVPLTGNRLARITGRRQPGTGRIIWHVGLGSGSDMPDPELRSEIDAAVEELRAHIEV
jgi:hypothetical protein